MEFKMIFIKNFCKTTQKTFCNLILLSCFSFSLSANISFSSRESRIKVNSGKFIVNTSIPTWDGTLESSGTVQGSSIIFSTGVLENQGTPALLTGNFIGNVTTPITLVSNHSLRIAPGMFSRKIAVVRNGNTIQGSPFFTDPNSINLSHQLSSITLFMQGALTSNIAMNRGTIILGDQLILGDDRTLTGSGRIVLNRNRFAFGGKNLHLTHTLDWLDASDIVLNGRTKLSGIWTFTGALARLNGNGNVLDLSAGGTILIKNGTTLYASNIKIRGLGIGNIIFENKTSTLRLSTAELEIFSNLTFTTGSIYVESVSRVVTGNKTLTFANQATLSIDQVTLFYDTLSFNDGNNIQPLVNAANNPGGKNVASVNNGVVCSLSLSTLIRTNSNALLFTAKNNSNTVLYLNKNNSNTLVTLASRNNANSNATININNISRTNSNSIVNLASASNIFVDSTHTFSALVTTVFDGKGCTIAFARSRKLINIAPDATLTLKNVTLKDFSPTCYDPIANGNLIFGTGTIIELPVSRDGFTYGIDLNNTWTFAGGLIVIDGQGQELSMASYDALSIMPGTTLMLKNMTLHGVGNLHKNNIKCFGPSATLILQDVEMQLTDDYSFTCGTLNFYSQVVLSGMNHIFSYVSPNRSNIVNNAQLKIDTGVTFSYDSIGGRRKFEVDSEGTLYLNGCEIHTTRTGLHITQGSLILDGQITFSSQARYDAEAIELDKNNITFNFLPNLILKYYGKIKVNS